MTSQPNTCLREIHALETALMFDHGVINLHKNSEMHLNESIGKNAKVFGVYIFYGQNNHQTQDHLLYIGKSGTIAQDGSIGDQTIAKRLLNVRAVTADGKKIKGRDYFPMLLNGKISESGPWDILRIQWIETYRKSQGIPPFLAEAKLLAAYLSDKRQLPPLNKKA